MRGPAGRRADLDLARGIALVAMAAAHFERVLSNQLGPAWLGHLLRAPNGRAGVLFVVLAGMGASLLVARDPRRGRARLAARAVCLLGLGYAFLFLWEADVLHVYGVLLLLAAALVRARGATLAGGILVAILGPVAFAAAGLDLDRGWVLGRLEYRDLWTLEGHVRHFVLNGYFPLVPWIAFVLYGVWLGRRVDRIRSMGAAAAGVWLGAEGAGALLTPRLGPIASTAAVPGGPLFVVASAALATAVLSLSGRIVRAGHGAALARLGRFSLTLYVLHIVVGIGVFDEFHRLGSLSLAQVAAWWVLFVWTALLGTRLWSARFRRGPLETLLRRLSFSEARA